MMAYTPETGDAEFDLLFAGKCTNQERSAIGALEL